MSKAIELAARLRALAAQMDEGAAMWTVGSPPNMAAPAMREAAALLLGEHEAASAAPALVPYQQRQVRRLQAVEPRVETGPVKFGDDWTGVFIRGDEAFGLANYLLAGIDEGRSADTTELRRELLRTTTRQLIALLLASDERRMPAGDAGASFAD